MKSLTTKELSKVSSTTEKGQDSLQCMVKFLKFLSTCTNDLTAQHKLDISAALASCISFERASCSSPPKSCLLIPNRCNQFFIFDNIVPDVCIDAKWHGREDVRKALTFAEYEKAQRTAAFKVNQMCKGVEKGQNFLSDFNVESGELAPMFIPGPFAIAHHLISSWVHEGAPGNSELLTKQLNSVSNL